MPEETQMLSVNKHYLEKVMDLAEEQDVNTTEDIFDSRGVKLIAKGTRISRGLQERLILHKLQKPLESCIALDGGIEINAIVAENPGVWEEKFKKEMVEFIKSAVVLEVNYIKDCLPNGVLGLNTELLKEYVQYIADRRFEKLHLPQFYGSNNPFPWMSEVIDLKKEKNFFETRVTEYQTGGALEW